MRRQAHLDPGYMNSYGNSKELLKAIRSVRPNSKGIKAVVEREIVFRKAFLSFDETSRFNVTNGLATIDNDVSRLLLINFLRKDPSPLVRHEAAFAIGWVGNQDCISVLQDALFNDKSFLVRHEAAMALSELGGVSEIQALQRGLRDRSREVVVSCRVAIHRIQDRINRRRGRILADKGRFELRPA